MSACICILKYYQLYPNRQYRLLIFYSPSFYLEDTSHKFEQWSKIKTLHYTPVSSLN